MNQSEATVQQALEWFPHQRNCFRHLGWKDHAFEFLIYWNGDLGCPTASPPGMPWQKLKRLEQYDGHDLQIASFICLDGLPIFYGIYPAVPASPNYDDNTKRQHLMDGWRPVVVTRHLVMMQFFGSPERHTFATTVEVRQTTFAHALGGRELGKSDDPMFAWTRYEVVRRDVVPGPPAETVCIGLQFSRGSMFPKMNTYDNAHFQRPAARYIHPLKWQDGCLTHGDDGLVRMGLASEAIKSEFRSELEQPHIQTQSPHDFLTVEFPCAVGAHLDVIVPFLAVEPEDFESEKELGFDKALAQTLDFWDGEMARGAEYCLPEPLAHNTLRAAPWQTLTIAERHPQLNISALVLGAFGYDGVWSVGSSMACVYNLDQLGFHEDAERYLGLYLAPKEPVSPPGKFYVEMEGFLTAPKPYEAIAWVADHGAVLWAVATHDLLTADNAFWEKWEPRVLQALEWIAAQRGVQGHDGHHGIIPPGQATDDDVDGQFVWNDAWIYKGLKTATEALARRKHPQAARWQAEANAYHKAFNKALSAAVESRGTWTDYRGRAVPFVPTELTGNLKQQGIDQHAFYLDTGPLVLPWSGLLDASDPLVDATLQWLAEGPSATRHLAESHSGQNPALIHEISSCEPVFSWNIFSRFLRHERSEFIEGMMSLLAGGQEPSVLSNVEHRHGMFGLVCNVVMAHLRNAYVFEDVEHNTLHLFRMVPREHLKAGDRVSWRRLPTCFGPMDLELEVGHGGRPVKAEITLPGRQAPAQVIVHPLPIEGGESPVINGRRHDAAKGPCVMSPVPQQLSIFWD